jgi:hypothetical protein
MRLCAACGLQIANTSELCPHHVPHGATWAESNRIMCDLIHRRKIPPRLDANARSDELWAHADAA